MKTMKKLAALALCLTLAAVNPISAFAADSYNWYFAASPSNTEHPRVFSLDYCSNGYAAKNTSKSGNCGTNYVILECKAYGDSSSTYYTLANITELNHLFTFGKPTFQMATVGFRATLCWAEGTVANNNGYVARR